METQRKVFSAFVRGEAVMGNRGVIPNGSDASFAYVARASPHGPTIIKFGSVTNGNPGRGLPVVQAYISILDPISGSLASFIDGESVTRIRTTAASMVAAQELAATSKNIAVIGAGLQGLAHARAALELFTPESLVLVSRKFTSEISDFQSEFPLVTFNQNIDEALKNSDLIFLCTNTVEPVIVNSPKIGATVISIGSFSPNREEVSGKIAAQADLIFGDDSKTIQAQSGSVIAALKESPELGEKIASLGTLLNNPKIGRTSADQIIIYFSVGLGIQDAAIVEKYFEILNS